MRGAATPIKRPSTWACPVYGFTLNLLTSSEDRRAFRRTVPKRHLWIPPQGVGRSQLDTDIVFDRGGSLPVTGMCALAVVAGKYKSPSTLPFYHEIRQTVTPRTRTTRSERVRHPSPGNLGRDTGEGTHERRETTNPARMRFGGYLVDGAQPKTPLRSCFNPRGQLPTMDGRCCPLRIQGSPSGICPFLATLPRSVHRNPLLNRKPPTGLWAISFGSTQHPQPHIV